MNERDVPNIVKAIVQGDPADRWMMRVALLEVCGIEVSAETLSLIGGCDVETAEGAIGGLMALGLTEPA